MSRDPAVRDEELPVTRQSWRTVRLREGEVVQVNVPSGPSFRVSGGLGGMVEVRRPGTDSWFVVWALTKSEGSSLAPGFLSELLERYGEKEVRRMLEVAVSLTVLRE